MAINLQISQFLTTRGSQPVSSNTSDFDILDTFEVVESTDTQVVDLSLVSDNKGVSPIAGFLVEVYLSGTDGRLTRLFREDDLNVDGSIESEGFSRFLNLEIDVEK